MDASMLIELIDLRKTYRTTEGIFTEVLSGLSLTIEAGEFVAIIGQSGSGKSTLMNILGLLDQPTGGTYRFAGRDVSLLTPDERARLRRDIFGFVFQQYHLLSGLNAAENVEIPAVYAAREPAERRHLARDLLVHLDLAGHLHHRPHQLSGGQQQRVSIARALMNGGTVILADEPTGALDRATSADVLALLQRLSAEGHTIILITHDREIASAAPRIIELCDGRIIADTITHKGMKRLPPLASQAQPHQLPPVSSAFTGGGDILRASARTFLAAPFRTFVTLLGIVMGVASVITLLAISKGAEQAVIDQFALFGSNRINIIPGGENRRGAGGRLLASDSDALLELPNVVAVTPSLRGPVTVRAEHTDYQSMGVATTVDFPRTLNWDIEYGDFFRPEDERAGAPVAILGAKLARLLFPEILDPVGQKVLVDHVPFEVIGRFANRGGLSGDDDDDDKIVFPLRTGRVRIFGKNDLSLLMVTIDDISSSEETAQALTRTLEARHHVRDFRVFDMQAAIRARNGTQKTMALLLGATAAISLIIGGLGVMNVMLMSVTERTREIGIRMAVGARRGDIFRQFLMEALLLSGLGASCGTLIGLLAGMAIAYFFHMPVMFSLTTILCAAGSALTTGLVFGFMPARRAARLEPVKALARE